MNRGKKETSLTGLFHHVKTRDIHNFFTKSKCFYSPRVPEREIRLD